MKHYDLRYMAKVAPIHDAVETLCSMTPVEYEHDSGFGFAPRMTAVPAQDLEKIPGATQRDGIGNYCADQTAVIPHLVRAIQELAARVKDLERRKPSRAKAAPVETAEG